MIGLVVTSASSWARQVVQKFKTSVPKLSLKDELAAKGVTTYPLDRVHQFQRMYLWKEVGAGRAGTLASWERMSLSAYRAYTGPEPIPSDVQIPSDIQRTIQKVQTIPGAKVFVERFDEDPFLFVSSAEGEEIYCFGYWNAPGFESDFEP